MKMSLRKQIIISFSVAFMMITALFGGSLYGYNSYHYPRQSYEYGKRIVGANIKLIDNYFTQLRNISGIVAADSDIIQAVTYRNHADAVDYSIELYNQRRVASKIKQLDVLSDITNAVITPIRDANQYFMTEPSYLLCDFRLEPIIAEKEQDADTRIAIYDGASPVCFPEECRMDEEQKAELATFLKGETSSFTVGKSGENPVSYLVVRAQSAISGWNILGIMPLTQMEEIQRTNGLFVLAMVVLACVVILYVASRISKSLLVPMNQLIGCLNQIAEGNQNVKLLPTRSVEMNRISETVGNMLENINMLTSSLLEKQRRLSEEQLKALQHQINPHFLNNILQTIKAMAVCRDTESISMISTLLGKLLSYSVYNPYDLVPLADELAYTENYIALQNVKWEGRIQYSMDF